MSGCFHAEDKLADICADLGKFLKKGIETFDGITDFESFTDTLTGIIGNGGNVSFLGNFNTNKKHNAMFLWDKWIGEI